MYGVTSTLQQVFKAQQIDNYLFCSYSRFRRPQPSVRRNQTLQSKLADMKGGQKMGELLYNKTKYNISSFSKPRLVRTRSQVIYNSCCCYLLCILSVFDPGHNKTIDEFHTRTMLPTISTNSNTKSLLDVFYTQNLFNTFFRTFAINIFVALPFFVFSALLVFIIFFCDFALIYRLNQLLQRRSRKAPCKYIFYVLKLFLSAIVISISLSPQPNLNKNILSPCNYANFGQCKQ